MAGHVEDPFPLHGESLERLARFFGAKRVAVTGATGLIGSYVVKLLREAGAVVRAICHDRERNEFTRMAQEWEPANLLDAKTEMEGLFDHCSAVVSCAGITGGVALPKKDPVSYVGPASVMAMNTLHAAHLAKVDRIGWLSSTTVYPPLDRPAREDDVNLGDDLYPLYRGIGESKRFLEKLFAYYHETTGIGIAVVRPSGAYGRYDNFDESTSHVLPGMVSRGLRLEPGQPFEVWGDGQDVRDFIHAQDVARCLLLAMASGRRVGPFNAASGMGVMTKSLARVVLDAVGMSGSEIVTSPAKPSALRSRLVETSQAYQEFGFRAEISLSAGVRDVVAWRRAQ
jgi:GDP-L-fucose synthase